MLVAADSVGPESEVLAAEDIGPESEVLVAEDIEPDSQEIAADGVALDSQEPDEVVPESQMPPDSITPELLDSMEMVPDSLPSRVFVCGRCGIVHEDRRRCAAECCRRRRLAVRPHHRVGKSPTLALGISINVTVPRLVIFLVYFKKAYFVNYALSRIVNFHSLI